jgi:hypothetical protein
MILSLAKTPRPPRRNKIKAIISRRARRERRVKDLQISNQAYVAFVFRPIFRFPCELCGLERSGREKKDFVSRRGAKIAEQIEREIEAGGILENCAILKNGISERMRIVDQKR